MIWLVPGSVIVVAYVLTDDSPRRALDPTASNSDTPNASVTVGSGGVGAP